MERKTGAQPAPTESEAELEAHYVAGYQAFPDNDADFAAVDRMADQSVQQRDRDDRPPATPKR